MSEAATPRQVTGQAATLLAPNPGPMTLDGTQSYLLRAGDGPVVVVDPGPADERHLATLAAAPVALILITHHHIDHTEGSERLHALTGAPVRAADPTYCHAGEPLLDGEDIEVGELRIRVMATPGHTADSLCFHLYDDGPHGSVLTGDTVLGRGSTVIGIPDGTLAQYLDSLERIAALGPCHLLPAHGPDRTDAAAVCREYLHHRRERLEQVRAALRRLGVTAARADPEVVTAEVYPDVEPGVRLAAQFSMVTQLAHLAAHPDG